MWLIKEEAKSNKILNKLLTTQRYKSRNIFSAKVNIYFNILNWENKLKYLTIQLFKQVFDYWNIFLDFLK